MEWNFLQILTSFFSATFPIFLGIPALLSFRPPTPSGRLARLLGLGFFTIALNICAIVVAAVDCLVDHYSILGLAAVIVTIVIAILIVIISYRLGKFFAEQIIHAHVTKK